MLELIMVDQLQIKHQPSARASRWLTMRSANPASYSDSSMDRTANAGVGHRPLSSLMRQRLQGREVAAIASNAAPLAANSAAVTQQHCVINLQKELQKKREA